MHVSEGSLSLSLSLYTYLYVLYMYTYVHIHIIHHVPKKMFLPSDFDIFGHPHSDQTGRSADRDEGGAVDFPQIFLPKKLSKTHEEMVNVLEGGSQINEGSLQCYVLDVMHVRFFWYQRSSYFEYYRW